MKSEINPDSVAVAFDNCTFSGQTALYDNGVPESLTFENLSFFKIKNGKMVEISAQEWCKDNKFCQ